MAALINQHGPTALSTEVQKSAMILSRYPDFHAVEPTIMPELRLPITQESLGLVL